MGFKEGDLISAEKNYYIISERKIRKFSSLSVLHALGYKPEMFREVTQDDLQYNDRGSDIISADSYVDGTLFRISDKYYQLQKNNLRKFVSDRAFLNHHDANDAIEQPFQFLSRDPVSENFIGFLSGTLLSSGNSVFISNGAKLSPIGDEIIFASMGFNWSDVMPATEEELSIYEKTKIFTVASPHPEGTIFSDRETGQYYITERHQGCLGSHQRHVSRRSWCV